MFLLLYSMFYTFWFDSMSCTEQNQAVGRSFSSHWRDKTNDWCNIDTHPFPPAKNTHPSSLPPKHTHTIIRTHKYLHTDAGLRWQQSTPICTMVYNEGSKLSWGSQKEKTHQKKMDEEWRHVFGPPWRASVAGCAGKREQGVLMTWEQTLTHAHTHLLKYQHWQNTCTQTHSQFNIWNRDQGSGYIVNVSKVKVLCTENGTPAHTHQNSRAHITTLTQYVHRPGTTTTDDTSET